jgi:hypothetical protein
LIPTKLMAHNTARATFNKVRLIMFSLSDPFPE